MERNFRHYVKFIFMSRNIAIDTDQKFHTDIEENFTNKQAQDFKYLRVSLKEKGINSEDIVSNIFKGRQIIGCMIQYGGIKILYISGDKKADRKMYDSINGLLWDEVWLLKRSLYNFVAE